MSKTKIILSRDDVFKIYLMTSDEAIRAFGEDYLDDYGIEVDKKFLEEFQEIEAKYELMQDKLFELYKKNRK